MPDMHFYARDLYPNQGLTDTRTITQPEADDKKAMEYDDHKEREVVQAETKGNVSSRSVLIAIVGIAIVGVVLGTM